MFYFLVASRQRALTQHKPQMRYCAATTTRAKRSPKNSKGKASVEEDRVRGLATLPELPPAQMCSEQPA